MKKSATYAIANASGKKMMFQIVICIEDPYMQVESTAGALLQEICRLPEEDWQVLDVRYRFNTYDLQVVLGTDSIRNPETLEIVERRSK